MRGKIYVIFILVALLTGVSVFFILRSPQSQGGFSLLPLAPVFNTTYAYVLPISEPSYIPILKANVAEPEVFAKSAIVYDLRAGRFLYSKNIRDRLPIASLTKVLTATVVLEYFKSSEVVTIGKDAIRVDGTKQDLFDGEQITVESLLRLMLIESSNDAAYAFASYARSKGVDFVAAMNDKARALGMEESHFVDPAGLDDQGYATAQDLVKLVDYALRYDQIWNILVEKDASVTSVDGKIIHTLKTTDQLLGIIPDIIGGKTGYTDGAGGCMILIVNVPGQNDKIISIVLGSGAQERFTDTQKLIDWVKEAYRWQ